MSSLLEVAVDHGSPGGTKFFFLEQDKDCIEFDWSRSKTRMLCNGYIRSEIITKYKQFEFISQNYSNIISNIIQQYLKPKLDCEITIK